MSFFERIPILLDGETVAEQLRRAREAKELSLEKVSRQLKIRPIYLQALEKGDYQLLPQGVYRLNFLREYAHFLGLDSQRLIQQFNREIKHRQAAKKQLFDRQVVSRRYLIALPQLLRNAIIGVLIVGCLLYVGLLLQRIFTPPFLIISFPPDNFSTSETRLLIKGQSEPETEIKINNETVLANNQGEFEREVYVQTGFNTITISAKKKYSQAAVIVRQILVKN